MSHRHSPATAETGTVATGALELGDMQLGVVNHAGAADFADVQQRLRRYRDTRNMRVQLLMFAILLAPLFGSVALHWRHAAPAPAALVSTPRSSALLPVAEESDTAIYWTLGDVAEAEETGTESAAPRAR